MPPFSIGPTTHKSKTAAINAMRTLVNSFHDQCVAPHHPAWPTLHALVDLHHNPLHIKTSSGIKYFHIRPCALNPNVNEIEVVTRLNRKTVLSYSSVIKNHGKDMKQRRDKQAIQRRKGAYRFCIKYQLVAYRNENPHLNRCEHCFKKCKRSEMHVDHMIEFDQIVNEFENCIWEEKLPTKFTSHPITHEPMFLTRDQSCEQSFQEYHLQRTKNRLQMVCKECNLSVLKKKGAVRNKKLVQTRIV